MSFVVLDVIQNDQHILHLKCHYSIELSFISLQFRTRSQQRNDAAQSLREKPHHVITSLSLAQPFTGPAERRPLPGLRREPSLPQSRTAGLQVRRKPEEEKRQLSQVCMCRKANSLSAKRNRTEPPMTYREHLARYQRSTKCS